MTYTGKTKNLGIIGYPVEHSLSPAMQLSALNKAGLDYSYIAMPVVPENLTNAITGLKSLNFCGFNVTIPHKINIINCLDSIDENAKMIGAVNTVVNKNGKLLGYNTDSIGFISSLKNHGFSIDKKNAVLLGAGGAARAVIWGLISAGISTLCLGVRNVSKAEPLIHIFEKFLTIEVFHWNDEQFQQKLKEADLLVNTTPLGMHPRVDEMPPVDWSLVLPQAFVYDLIYTPETTKFLQMAKANHNTTINGEGMLVEQGAAAFKLWTDVDADTKIMHQALKNIDHK